MDQGIKSLVLSALNAALAAAIAMSLSMVIWMLVGATNADALLRSLGIAAIAFGFVWLGVFVTMCLASGREPSTAGRPTTGTA